MQNTTPNHTTVPHKKMLISAYNTPDGSPAQDYLKKLCSCGVKARYKEQPGEAEERLSSELAVIDEAGLSECFLAVWDIVNYAKSHGISIGPGRGSSVGSIVCYTLGITDVDPIENRLFFERFINPAVQAEPNITIDISARGWRKVVDYVKARILPCKRDGNNGRLIFELVRCRELDVIDDTLRFAKKRGSIDIDLGAIDCSVKSIYKGISAGKTEQFFQLNSIDTRLVLKVIKPANLSEIAAAIAMCRPGALKLTARYVSGKTYPKEIKYTHPLLKDILGETYGCILYQEQIIEVIQALTGCSASRADEMRRTITRGSGETISSVLSDFILASKAYADAETAAAVFDEIRDASVYAFNKSHAIAYALFAYRMAYLRSIFLVEFDWAYQASMM